MAAVDGGQGEVVVLTHRVRPAEGGSGGDDAVHAGDLAQPQVRFEVGEGVARRASRARSWERTASRAVVKSSAIGSSVTAGNRSRASSSRAVARGRSRARSCATTGWARRRSRGRDAVTAREWGGGIGVLVARQRTSRTSSGEGVGVEGRCPVPGAAGGVAIAAPTRIAGTSSGRSPSSRRSAARQGQGVNSSRATRDSVITASARCRCRRRCGRSRAWRSAASAPSPRVAEVATGVRCTRPGATSPGPCEASQQHAHVRTLRTVVGVELVEDQVAQGGAGGVPQGPVGAAQQQLVEHLVVGEQDVRDAAADHLAVGDEPVGGDDSGGLAEGLPGVERGA